MSKIIGVTVGTPQNPEKIIEKTNVDEKIDEALRKAKESGEFDGDNGKTAYQYAQAGGYTGTEEEFAQKMAEEYVKATDYATASKAGIVMVKDSTYGLKLDNGKEIRVVGASKKDIDEKSGNRPIKPTELDYAVKSAMTTNTLEWTEEEKQSARDLIGASDSGIEVTSGEPTKESTVMTLNPNAEEVNLYTAEEIDAKFDAFINAEEVSY